MFTLIARNTIYIGMSFKELNTEKELTEHNSKGQIKFETFFKNQSCGGWLPLVAGMVRMGWKGN